VAFSVTRFHDISCGHRVTGHEGSCSRLHGHNYRIHFTLRGVCDTLDLKGRVVDFSYIKGVLCRWLDEHWDHRFLIWEGDALASTLKWLDQSVVLLEFNPTAENMAQYLLHIGKILLQGTGIYLVSVRIEETAKCSATYEED
jgi:6-pyruvoyltetrahydropterin/6-carboxytetrahydropterin synthase